MRIALVGMSNVGKSHWSKRFSEELGFHRLCCDDEIAKAVLPEGQNLASWLGMPTSDTYKIREKTYLETEERVLNMFLNRAYFSQTHELIDTTGSVIYLPEPLLHRLRQTCVVVYLAVNASHLHEMTRTFLAHPKPLLWMNHVSYPELLASREMLYQKLAHVTIPFETHRHPSFSVKNFLYEISKYESARIDEDRT